MIKDGDLVFGVLQFLAAGFAMNLTEVTRKADDVAGRFEEM